MSYSDPSDGFSLGGLVVVSSDLQPHCPWYAGGRQTEVRAPKQTLPTLYVSPAGRVRFSFNSEWHAPSEMHVMTDLFKSALKISYNSVKEMVRLVGQRLRELLEPMSVVLIYADGSINWVIAMFAVLWANLRVPQEDTGTLTPDGCKLKLCVETILREAQGRQQNGPDPAIRQPKPLSAAYICFPSGSTGKPKAIQCTHSGVVSVLRDPVARLHVGLGVRVAQMLAPAFDGALQEVFSTLCYGGTLILKTPTEPFEHLRVADSVDMTPSLAAELNPEDYPNLKYIYLSAEVLPQHTADRWPAGQASVYNMCGPTECHMVSSAQKLKPGQFVTIGTPFESARVYILDRQGALSPLLIAGEIHIAGVQVSPGYIGLDEETKQRFIPNTIWPTDGGRMYRTMDWSYWTLDGQVAFIGRMDRQVKLAGFRVDLNDVQARLEKAISPKVRVCCCRGWGCFSLRNIGWAQFERRPSQSSSRNCATATECPETISRSDAGKPIW
ncbi:hypothetical protein UA08_08442 [Talaromyces atroroseus]|uniref:AMP-dependent synthetase/ligase domain-containing protein n=1 Tax=Talaromyces atroroseus TaxID=1441469 RepID=A0A1Q5Q7J1_TALAT|nr:hypothetical protein UA08_08442 [Talaromyces atroroseus]OKL56190.1 hypothetical protein UA08_08442 [Talaromyces atroroseus]